MALAFFAECAYLVIPIQSYLGGRLSLDDNSYFVALLGAPLAYLAGRAAWAEETRAMIVVVFASWIWIGAAFALIGDPHGVGPRTWWIAVTIGWLPAANMALLVLFLVGRRLRGGADSLRVSALKATLDPKA